MKYFKLNYFLVFLLLLFIETIIAIYHFNPFIRGFLGDVLVIILIYSFLKIFLKTASTELALAILLFAYAIEVLQLFKLMDVFSIKSRILRVVLGSVFDPWYFVAYTLGIYCFVRRKFFGKNQS